MDFELWARTCVKIIDKDTKALVPFILNAPQRRLLALMEEKRRLGLPIRIIMLKSRQWGGSTFVQIYFAWIQIMHLRNWHSLICAHKKDTAAAIRGMYTRLLENYPSDQWPDEDGRPAFRPFEGMTDTRHIPGRGCMVTVCSSDSQNATRGMDYSMVHLSEVAFWKKTRLHDPVDVIRSVAAGVARRPMTIVVIESTANGTGSYFHTEWNRAVEGLSDKTPFFVPWFEIERYREPVPDPEAFLASLSDYERTLLHEHKAPLEAIMWYRNKAREYQDHRSMMAEFPSTPQEAFSETDRAVFSTPAVEALREAGCSLTPQRGEVDVTLSGGFPDLSAPRFNQDAAGGTLVWRRPVPGRCYIASLDIGGRSSSADYSVITVLSSTRRDGSPEPRPEVVAQWRGHIDHDLLAWKAAALAAWYNNALLVVESNSWESSSEGRGQYILHTLADNYPNLYRRRASAIGAEHPSWLPGFHTNTRTKGLLVSNLIRMVREGAYIEHDPQACNELLQYEIKPDGTYGARQGCHDDILMSRAIALWIHTTESATHLPTPNTPTPDLTPFFRQ